MIMDDGFFGKLFIWLAGAFVTVVNGWALFWIKGIKDDHKQLREKTNHEVGDLHEKVNKVTTEMHRDFVRKDDLRELKKDMDNRFDRLEDLITNKK